MPLDSSLLLAALVAVPLSLAAFQALLASRSGRLGALAMLLASSFVFAGALRLLDAAPVAEYAVPWIDGLDVWLRLRADSFGLFFAMLVSGVGALVAVYSYAYLDGISATRQGRFYAALILFMTAMVGVAVADDWLTLALFWETTSVSSWMLIGFWYEDDKARSGANTALQVTALGGLVMLVGFLVLASAAGTFSIHDLAADPALRARVAESGFFETSLLLILVGAFTKSAQFPFHFWLPGAMVAPTPVSTYLHAATMVKAGVFLLGRIAPIFSESYLWSPILVTVGLVTFLLGSWQAFFQNDLKALLARTTVAALGLMTLTYGLGLAAQDSLQILTHATYKGCLFLCAGIVEHAAGTRDLRELGGLRRELPGTFWLAVAGVLGMAGLPPTMGFLGKEALYAGIAESHVLAGSTRVLVLGLAVLANALMVAAGLRFVIGAFLGAPPSVAGHRAREKHDTHGESSLLCLPPATLTAVSLAAFAGAAGPATQAWLQRLSSTREHPVEVSIVHLHSLPLALSVVTLGVGIALYLGRYWIAVRRPLFTLSAQSLWDRALQAVVSFATAFAARWQSGSLHWYFSATLLFVALLPLFALQRQGLSTASIAISLDNLSWYGGFLCVAAAIASIGVATAPTRLAAAISLTGVGFLVAAIFVVYRSPDIVLTQILIETVSTIFILLVLYRMPPFSPERVGSGRRSWNLVLSVAVGLTVFVTLLLASTPALRLPRSISLDYLARSLGEAGGTNVVNVIIVDFRAIDTTGEITVLVVVGLCVWGLLRSRRRAAA